jgi:hypothetical protein
MTHDELLAELDKRIELTHELGGCHQEQHALRAIVQLHKPVTSIVWSMCLACGITSDYPCPTIQAIEKELL